MANRSYSIDFDPFGTGQREAIRANRELLDYGQAYQKQFDDMSKKIEQENVDTFLSSIPANQAVAASMGQGRDQYWQNQQESILRDPQFYRMTPTTQRQILDKVRSGAQTDVMNMFQRGEFEGARRLAETMGLVSPSNQLLEALQAENPAAVSQAMGGINSQWQGQVTPQGELRLNNQTVPAEMWLNELSRRKLTQPGAGSAAALSQQNLERQLAVQGMSPNNPRVAQQEQANKMQAAMLLSQLSTMQQTPQVQTAMQLLSDMLGVDAQVPSMVGEVPTLTNMAAAELGQLPQQVAQPQLAQSVPIGNQPSPQLQQLYNLLDTSDITSLEEYGYSPEAAQQMQIGNQPSPELQQLYRMLDQPTMQQQPVQQQATPDFMGLLRALLSAGQISSAQDLIPANQLQQQVGNLAALGGNFPQAQDYNITPIHRAIANAPVPGGNQLAALLALSGAGINQAERTR